MIEADSVHITPGRFTPKIVGGTHHDPCAASRPVVDHSSSEQGLEYVSTRKRPAEPMTETARNARLRKERNDVWGRAEAATRYWRVKLEFIRAVDVAQGCGAVAAHDHEKWSREEDRDLVHRYRQALVEQLLTPAPDNRAVAWKQLVVDRDDYVFRGGMLGPEVAGSYVKKERVLMAIAADQAFLAAHPVRRNKAVQS
jgi:hypothetical protein